MAQMTSYAYAVHVTYKERTSWEFQDGGKSAVFCISPVAFCSSWSCVACVSNRRPPCSSPGACPTATVQETASEFATTPTYIYSNRLLIRRVMSISTQSLNGSIDKAVMKCSCFIGTWENTSNSVHW